ncbi:MAG: protein kinase [Vulcanimicrobiota bacterium]
MFNPGDTREFGSYRIRIDESLGGRKNLTFKVSDVENNEPYILRVIEKPSLKSFQTEYLEGHEEVFKVFFEENEMLKEKHGTFNEAAAFEILTAAFQGQVVQEAKVLKEYNHPGLSRLLFYTSDDSAYYLLLNYVEGRSINQIIESGEEVSEEKALSWMIHIAETLDFLHTHPEEKLLYNNLNPLNIIIDEKEGRACLVDLHMIRIYLEESDSTEEWQDVLALDAPAPFCPLEGYKSPRAEIYALGATFYQLLTGEPIPPVQDRVAHDTIMPLKGGKKKYSRKIWKALELCLELDYRKRLSSCGSLLRILNSDEFPTVRVERDDAPLKDISLGKIGGGFESIIPVKIYRPVDDPLPLRLEGLKSTWKMKPDDIHPKLALIDIEEKGDYAEAKLKITCGDLPPGRYEGHACFETNWGGKDILVTAEMPRSFSPVPVYITGAVIVLILIVIGIWRIVSPPSLAQIHTRWNRENWEFIRNEIPRYLVPKFSIDNTERWEIYNEIPTLTVLPENNSLSLSGSVDKNDPFRTGWIMRFFRPAGDITVSVVLEGNKGEGVPYESAGLMLLSSDGTAFAVESSKKGTEASAGYKDTLKKWEFPPSETPIIFKEDEKKLIKMEYSSVDGTVIGFINGKKVGETQIEFSDISIFLYAVYAEKGAIRKITFRGLDVILGPPVPIKPSFFCALGKVVIKEKPDEKAKSVITTYENEKLYVLREENNDWCKVRTVEDNGKYEGWVRRKDMRSLTPREVKLD